MILTSVNSETTNGDNERDDSEGLGFYNENNICVEHLSDSNLEVTSGNHYMKLFDVLPILFIFITWYALYTVYD